jgi:hypothetical protein
VLCCVVQGLSSKKGEDGGRCHKALARYSTQPPVEASLFRREPLSLVSDFRPCRISLCDGFPVAETKRCAIDT